MNRRHSSPAPDLVLFNGSIGVPGFQTAPHQALAVRDGLIFAVGKSRDIRALAGSKTECLNLDNRLVLPGFTDSHLHFHEWALKTQELQLHHLQSLEALLEQVRSKTRELPAGHWISGQGWNESDWPEAVMPDRDTLDAVAPEHPVILWRCDLHLAAANSAALKRAGIGPGRPDPPRGTIERDSQGRPTGILRELAINLVRDAIAPPGPEQTAAAYLHGSSLLHRYGVTGIHDIRLMDDQDGARALRTFQELDDHGLLKLRCWATLSGNRLEEAIRLGLRSGFGNERLRIGHLKFFADGGVGARTAWMSEPYLDGGSGLPMIAMDELERQIHRADRAGLSVMVHVIGDRANREVIDIFAGLYNRPDRDPAGRPHYPHRLEHLQIIRPEELQRLRALPLALGATPANLLLDINLIERALGKRGIWAYGFRQLFDTGRPVMFSSDCPVCLPKPLLGIHAAVTRRRPETPGQDGWYPEARVSIAEAVRAYTTIPAEVHRAPELGTLEPGSKADLVVLSRNILTGPPEDILAAEVDLTLFNGEMVHRRF